MASGNGPQCSVLTEMGSTLLVGSAAGRLVYVGLMNCVAYRNVCFQFAPTLSTSVGSCVLGPTHLLTCLSTVDSF